MYTINTKQASKMEKGKQKNNLPLLTFDLNQFIKSIIDI